MSTCMCMPWGLGEYMYMHVHVIGYMHVTCMFMLQGSLMASYSEDTGLGSHEDEEVWHGGADVSGPSSAPWNQVRTVLIPHVHNVHMYMYMHVES